jgi:RNA polymerase-associated protein
MAMVKRSVMTLYSGAADIHSHRVRIVLAEKGVTVDILNINVDEPPEDLVSLNPYNTVPTLVDRELVLYNANIIMEYLDERFPHPPLLPVYPVARAKSRLMVHRIERDWYNLANIIETGKPAAAEQARSELRDNLKSLAPVFAEMPYFLSEEFSLVDCTIGPLLWRLPHYGIDLTTAAKQVTTYATRLFKRDAFQASLTETEREMREKHVA